MASIDEATASAGEAPLARLAALVALDGSAEFERRAAVAGPVLVRASLFAARFPGLFIDEAGYLEARWTFDRRGSGLALVVNVSFGELVEIYVFDRAYGEVVYESSLELDDPVLADAIGAVLVSTESDTAG